MASPRKGAHDDVDARARRAIHHLLGPCSAARIEDVRDAEILQVGRLGTAASGGEDLGPDGPGDLHRRESEPSCS